MIRVGLAGYGLAGSVFHAPLIQACARMELAAVLTRRPAPSAVASIDELLRQSDLIVVATPNETHFDIALTAIDAGKHVVVDKPFTTSVEQANRLISLAFERQVTISVFHNRRWDGDFLTVQRLLPELGDIAIYEGHWDRFRPAIKQGWKEEARDGTGLLNDLGPHLVDQALQLFGTPDALQADVARQRRGAQVDDHFEITSLYGPMRARLGASSLIADPRPRFAVHGSGGSFVKHGLDPQEEQLKSGILPASPTYGAGAANGWFTAADGGRREVPTARGNYPAFYEQVAAALLDGGPVPVSAQQAREVMAIIALARQSAEQGCRLNIKRKDD